MADETSVLTCWKDIASYLGKTVRTVQRWERELGMPVHRPKGPSTKVVCALPEELAQWISTADLEAKPLTLASRDDLRALLARLETLITENAELSRRSVAILRDLETGRARLTTAVAETTRLLSHYPSPNHSNGSPRGERAIAGNGRARIHP